MAASTEAAAAAAATAANDDDQPAVFDTAHYPGGLNGDFVTPTDGTAGLRIAVGAAGKGGRKEKRACLGTWAHDN